MLSFLTPLPPHPKKKKKDPIMKSTLAGICLLYSHRGRERAEKPARGRFLLSRATVAKTRVVCNAAAKVCCNAPNKLSRGNACTKQMKHRRDRFGEQWAWCPAAEIGANAWSGSQEVCLHYEASFFWSFESQNPEGKRSAASEREKYEKEDRWNYSMYYMAPRNAITTMRAIK